jgi:hypothetical protein
VVGGWWGEVGDAFVEGFEVAVFGLEGGLGETVAKAVQRGGGGWSAGLTQAAVDSPDDQVEDDHGNDEQANDEGGGEGVYANRPPATEGRRQAARGDWRCRGVRWDRQAAR